MSLKNRSSDLSITACAAHAVPTAWWSPIEVENWARRLRFHDLLNSNLSGADLLNEAVLRRPKRWGEQKRLKASIDKLRERDREIESSVSFHDCEGVVDPDGVVLPFHKPRAHSVSVSGRTRDILVRSLDIRSNLEHVEIFKGSGWKTGIHVRDAPSAEDGGGVEISAIDPGSAADVEGSLRVGDRLIAINGYPVSSSAAEAQRQLQTPGDEMLQLLVNHRAEYDVHCAASEASNFLASCETIPIRLNDVLERAGIGKPPDTKTRQRLVVALERYVLTEGEREKSEASQFGEDSIQMKTFDGYVELESESATEDGALRRAPELYQKEEQSFMSEKKLENPYLQLDFKGLEDSTIAEEGDVYEELKDTDSEIDSEIEALYSVPYGMKRTHEAAVTPPDDVYNI